MTLAHQDQNDWTKRNTESMEAERNRKRQGNGVIAVSARELWASGYTEHQIAYSLGVGKRDREGRRLFARYFDLDPDRLPESLELHEDAPRNHIIVRCSEADLNISIDMSELCTDRQYGMDRLVHFLERRQQVLQERQIDRLCRAPTQSLLLAADSMKPIDVIVADGIPNRRNT